MAPNTSSLDVSLVYPGLVSSNTTLCYFTKWFPLDSDKTDIDVRNYFALKLNRDEKLLE